MITDEYTEAYNQGASEMLSAIRKLQNPQRDGGIPAIDLLKMFCMATNISDVINKYSPNDIIDKVKAYEDAKYEFKVGDVVEGELYKGLVTKVYSDTVFVVYQDGSCNLCEKKYLKKTNRHFNEIEDILRRL